MNGSGPALRDIHVPPASWWPPGPGWWLIALIVLVAAALIAWGWIAYRRRAALRAALREINRLERAFGQDGDPARLVDGASRLLRRVARRIDPEMASRTGAAWRTFVGRYAHGPDVQKPLDQLEQARFHPDPVLDAEALLPALRVWCRRALRARPRPPSTRRDKAVDAAARATRRARA